VICDAALFILWLILHATLEEVILCAESIYDISMLQTILLYGL